MDAVTMGAVQAEQLSANSLETSQIIAIGAGFVVGCALCYIGYRFYKGRKDKNVNLFKNTNRFKRYRELLTKQEHISVLNSSNLKKWFQDNHVAFADTKLMIAIPSEKVINAIGYKLEDSDVLENNSIIQCIYNSKSGLVYKLRCISYESIESNLQVKLLENSGLVILNDNNNGGIYNQ